MAKTRGTSKQVLGVLWVAVALAMPGRSDAQIKAIAGGTPPPEAPLSLTASDGTGLQLTSLSARVVVEDPLAFTELHLAFRQPRGPGARGPLPHHPAAGRGDQPLRHEDRRPLAGGRGGRAAGGPRRPTRTSCTAGRTRRCSRPRPATSSRPACFPIPARATKELIVSYSQELTRAGEPYRLPLRGLPRLGALRGRVRWWPAPPRRGRPRTWAARVPATRSSSCDRDGFTPDRDFEVAAGQRRARLGLRHENLVVARVRGAGRDAAARSGARACWCWSTPAPRAPWASAIRWRRLSALLTGLRGPGGRSAADGGGLRPDGRGRSTAAGPAASAPRRSRSCAHRRALGASDLRRRWPGPPVGPRAACPARAAGHRRRRHRRAAGQRAACGRR